MPNNKQDDSSPHESNGHLRRNGKAEGDKPQSLPVPRESGVLGETMSPHHELGMVERALRNGWPVTKEMRQKCLDKAEQILAEGKTGYALGAIKCILQADAINVKREGHLVSKDNTQVTALSHLMAVHLANNAPGKTLADLSAELCQLPAPEGEPLDGSEANQ